MRTAREVYFKEVSIYKKWRKKQDRLVISSLVTRGVGIAAAEVGLVMFFWALPAMLKHMLDHSECLGGTIHFSGLAALQGRERFYIRKGNLLLIYSRCSVFC